MGMPRLVGRQYCLCALLYLRYMASYKNTDFEEPHPLTMQAPSSLLPTTIVESGFLHWLFCVRSTWRTTTIWPLSPTASVAHYKNKLINKLGHAADRPYTGSGLALLMLWLTPSCSPTALIDMHFSTLECMNIFLSLKNEQSYLSYRLERKKRSQVLKLLLNI